MTRSLLQRPDGSFDPLWIHDWSQKGYRNGAAIPVVPVVANPQTLTDFLNAIVNAPTPGTVLVPNGKLTVEEVIRPPSGRVIRWQAQSELFFPDPLSVMRTDQPALQPDGKSMYSWQDGVIHILGKTEVGLEMVPGTFGITFPSTNPHVAHFNEPGYNGISYKGCTDCWGLNLSVLNSDSGIFVERGCARVTVRGAHVKSNRIPNNNWQGHHAIEMQRATDCVVHDYFIDVVGIHDLTVEDVLGCVASKGKHRNGIMDHHKTFAIGRNIVSCLFTDIDLGTGTRHPFDSSGNPSAPNVGASGNVYWNVRKNGRVLSATTDDPTSPSPFVTDKLVIVPHQRNEQTLSWWLEVIA